MTENNSNHNLKQRNDIADKYKWNLSAMYANEDLWEADFAEVSEMSKDFSSFEGKLAESSDILLAAMKAKDSIWQKIEKIYVYARMRKDENNKVSRYQAMSDRCNSLIALAASNMSFFTPELLSIPFEKVMQFINENKDLEIYRFAIMDMFKDKEHVLSHKEENLLAIMSEVTSATNDIFSMLNNADMKFGKITNEDGELVELTQGNYITFMQSKDRNVRKEAFEKKYQAYIDLINTIAVTYNYNTKTDAVMAKLRKYPSSLEASLSGDNIKKEVYLNLIDTVHEALPHIYKYMELRKKILGVDELHMYDIYAPLAELNDEYVSYEKALEIMQEGLAYLGEEYLDRMMAGVNSGWIDVYENEGKTSGAYSFGSYDSFPYILMNYSDRLKDVFTLVHEMGHSMHSSYTRENQPFIYGDHSIFTAEVASTVNEALLMHHLVKNASDKETKKYLVALHLEEFRTTLFRQTMFAEFELITHEAVERGEVLTAEWMCEKYAELNKLYFGPDVIIDEQIKYEWARIPHFYRAFYVYKYATGYSAATAIASLITSNEEAFGENPARDAYKKFLSSGSSNYPIELLKIAGVDMSSKEPIQLAMKTFAELVDELESLI